MRMDLDFDEDEMEMMDEMDEMEEMEMMMGRRRGPVGLLDRRGNRGGRRGPRNNEPVGPPPDTYEILRLLLKYGANPNCRNRSGQTPLFYALGNDTATKILLEAGTDVSFKQVEGADAHGD